MKPEQGQSLSKVTATKPQCHSLWPEQMSSLSKAEKQQKQCQSLSQA
jgi:hypothetical protein